MMQSCWNLEAEQRPTFAELQAQLDGLVTLNATAQQYLELEQAFIYDPTPADANESSSLNLLPQGDEQDC